MDEIQKNEMVNCEKRLEAAQLLLLEGRFEDSINRAYYSMFHCARALLYSRNISFKTHRGLLVKFTEVFVRSGEIGREFAAILSNTETLRENADYGLICQIGEDDARSAVQDAKQFMDMVRDFFEKH